MADFTKTAISQNAKREYISPIPNFDSFNEVIEAFKNDTTMGLTKKEQTSVTYKAKVIYFDAASNECGYCTFTTEDAARFEDIFSILEGNEVSETFGGIGGSSSHDSSENTWTVKFSCTNTVTVGSKEIDDIFTITIGKDYMSVTGFSYDETLAKIETWADSQSTIS